MLAWHFPGEFVRQARTRSMKTGNDVYAATMTVLRSAARSSWNHSDAGNRVNLVPLRMKSVLHVTPNYPDPRADWREHNGGRVALARTLSVLLCHGKPAYDFEHEVTVLSAHVAGI